MALMLSNRPALPVVLPISAIALPVAMTMPSDMVMPLFIIFIDPDCMPVSMEASEPEDFEAGVDSSFHAIVTAGAEGVGMACMDRMEVAEVDDDGDDCARATGARPKTRPDTTEKRIFAGLGNRYDESAARLRFYFFCCCRREEKKVCATMKPSSLNKIKV